ncbi:MAG TPA: rod shape-determining protein MreC [Acidobacteriaceae bacterium]|nr:rod shape-determining protein MreC [Acidobacteriaceae bacterium]
MDLLLRFRNALFLIAVLLAQAIALAVQVRTPANATRPDTSGVRLIRMWTNGVITPFERGAQAIGWTVHHGWSNYIDLRHVRQQNQQLQQQLTQMRIQEAAIAEDAREGRRLQALLAFKEKYVASTVVAQVIGTSGSDLTHVLTIDKGSNDGVKPDMAVITPDGIVGKIREVFPATAEVLEINDQTSGAGVVLENTRIRAILHGTSSGRAQIGNLTADSRIKPGEPVVTSGGDQVYPRGLPVGTVQSIAPDPDRQPYTDIVIKPAVDLNRVEEVLVITSLQSNLPADAQQDLAAAQAQHAADISAERLPGIHDDDPAANGAAGKVATPPVAPGALPVLPIPHPVPPLHTDRYTSGATPPAVNLSPGVPVTPQAVPLDSGQSSHKSTSPKDSTQPDATQ